MSTLEKNENVESERKEIKIDSLKNYIKNLAKDEKFSIVSRFYKFIPDTLIFGVIKAMLTIALIPLILKYGFGIEKHKKPNPEEIQNNKVQSPTINKFMEVRK